MTRSQDPMANPQMQEAMKKAMQDPKMAAQLEQIKEAMKDPAAMKQMQQEMQQMQALMQNKNAIARIQELRNDPEMEPFWKDVQAGGMPAMMKYYNDPEFLEMIGRKLGDVIPSGAAGGAGGGGGAAAAPAAPPMAEVTDLLSAARVGDDEAVEDFLAVGKDVGMKDAQSRTPLHFAAGYNHKSIAKMLIEAGAPLEAQDSMGNTPLLYASGYGRAELVELLIAAGASKEAANTNGKTAYALATADPRNPLSQNEKILEMLKL